MVLHPRVELENTGHQSGHFFNSNEVFLIHVNFKGAANMFTKALRVNFIGCSWYVLTHKILPSFPTVLWS